jgi:hypothetical protein
MDEILMGRVFRGEIGESRATGLGVARPQTRGAAMLSHHEDDQLRAIEQWFEESDPTLTRMLREYEVPRRRELVGRIAVDVVGALLFVLGAVLVAPVLLVFGLLFVTVGVCLHLAAGTRLRQGQPPR